MDIEETSEHEVSGRGRRLIHKRQRKDDKKTKPEYIKFWSDTEKQILLDLLYKYGDQNLEMFTAELPNKHISQIKTYLRTISRRAMIANQNHVDKKESIELDKWLEHLKTGRNAQEVNDAVPLRLFEASCEFRKPDIKYSNGVVDFKKAYEYLYALSIGRKIDIDQETYYFVHSYFDWFINQYDKCVLPVHLEILECAMHRIKKVSTNRAVMHNQILYTIFNRVLPQERYLSIKYLFRTVCHNLKKKNFIKGEEFNSKITLLRDKAIDESSQYIDSTPSPCKLIPYDTDTEFKNLPSFVWAALGDLNNQKSMICSPANKETIHNTNT